MLDAFLSWLEQLRTTLMKNNRPSFGRKKSERGLDLFDTPPIALEPLFAHEPLLAGVRAVCEPFCGKGNLVTAMRGRPASPRAPVISSTAAVRFDRAGLP